MAKSPGGNTFGEEGAETIGDWPPHFPHREIDALLARVDGAGQLSAEEATQLLGLVAREAQRLRSTVVRLSATKLSEADQEARAILADADAEAKSLRRAGLSVLDDRLDEAEHLLASMRAAFKVELRAASKSKEPRKPERLSAARMEQSIKLDTFSRHPRLPEQPHGGRS